MDISYQLGFSLLYRVSFFITLNELKLTKSSIIPLYYLVRKPTLILDFAATMTGLHFLFTTAHVQSPPLGFFCYGIYALGIVVLVVGAEQLAMRRELRRGLWGDRQDDYEMSTRRNYNQHRRANQRPAGLGLVLDSPDINYETVKVPN